MAFMEYLLTIWEIIDTFSTLILYYCCVFLFFCAPLAAMIFGAIFLNNYIDARRKNKLNPDSSSAKKARINLTLFIISAVIVFVTTAVILAFIVMFFSSLAYM